MQQKGVFTIEEAAGEFRADFLDEERVRLWLFRKLNPAGPRCPHCGEPVLPGKAAATFWAGGRVCCKRKGCKAYFTASTGTMIAGAALTEREIFLVAVLLGFEVPVAEIAEITGRTEDTVRFWRSKLAVASELASPSVPSISPGPGSLPQGEGGGARKGAGDVVPVCGVGSEEPVALLDLAVAEGLPADQVEAFLSRKGGC